MNRPIEASPTTLRYGRGRTIFAALFLTAAATGFWAVALAQGGTSWPVIVGFGAILLLTTALAIAAVGMAVGPNQILLTRDRLTIRRGFESISVPWSAIMRLADRRDRIRGVPVQFLEVHVRQRSDIAYGGSARILARLSRSSSPVIRIALRSGIPLLVGHDPDEAADLIRRYLATHLRGSTPEPNLAER